MVRKPGLRYHSDGMTAISKSRVRDFGGAARMFANRLGRFQFGRGGQMFSVKRIMPVRRAPRDSARYRAVIGTKRGVKTEIEFLITLW